MNSPFYSAPHNALGSVGRDSSGPVPARPGMPPPLKGQSVTHVSGIPCYLSLRKNKNLRLSVLFGSESPSADWPLCPLLSLAPCDCASHEQRAPVRHSLRQGRARASNFSSP